MKKILCLVLSVICADVYANSPIDLQVEEGYDKDDKETPNETKKEDFLIDNVSDKEVVELQQKVVIAKKKSKDLQESSAKEIEEIAKQYEKDKEAVRKQYQKICKRAKKEPYLESIGVSSNTFDSMEDKLNCQKKEKSIDDLKKRDCEVVKVPGGKINDSIRISSDERMRDFDR